MFSISYSASSHTSLKPRYIPHILMRRYVLTLTAYKFLDIGIVVGSTSDIERLMQPTVSSSSSSIQDLNVELVKVHDTKNVKLSLYDSNIECELIVYTLDNIVNSVKSKCTFYC
ncbi:hypothetical protein ALC56_05556 [Trachymyrmex septentrionalis]|uniref:Uncharacterized protein n=1 Tax=Trachymyrmex septentrionalis TaxID=34720 RepID=A0A151JXV5_9HYME|nr:hypothetical protein ALC56_05556 [Trachymyrmex septentrionalis]